MAIPNCPECQSAYAYEDRHLFVCPECGHEWSTTEEATEETEQGLLVRDAHGNELVDGDSITIVKDLKVKGSTNPLKQGTNIKNIRLIDGVDDHNIDCKIPGFGPMQLKSEFVKKI